MSFVRWLLTAALFVNVSLAQSNPVPLIYQPLVPSSVPPGSSDFTLTVNGTGFVQGAVVGWNGIPLATTFISSSQLTATVPAQDVATSGTASVTVLSPSPGGGKSNVDYFTAREPFSGVSFGNKNVETGTESDRVLNADLNSDGAIDLVLLDLR